MIHRGASIDVMQPLPEGEGGANPTAPLLFIKRDWWVYDVDMDIARRLVELYHYAGAASNTATFLHGLFPRDAFWEAACAGIAWWIPPTKTAAQHAHPENWQGVLSLSRLVIAPGVPPNACTFLLRHSMRQIDRQRWPVLVTYADEWQGHTGHMYKVSGWRETGWTKPERCYVRDGKMVSRKAGPRTRTHKEMLKLGCVCVGSFRKKRFTHEV